MNKFRRITAAATAFLMFASAAAPSSAGSFADIMSVYAAEDYSDYAVYAKIGSVSIGSKADFDALKSFSDYTESDAALEELTGMESRKVIEVPVEIVHNTGFFGLSMKLSADEELTFAGYKKENGSVTAFKGCGISTNGSMFTYLRNETSNTTEEGTLVTALYVLPESYPSGKEYTIEAKDLDAAKKKETSGVSDISFEYEAAKVTFAEDISDPGTQVVDGDYVVEIAKVTKKLDELKTFAEYEGLYKADVPSKLITDEHADNKVVEVPLILKKNAGINTGSIDFTCDEDMLFAGCVLVDTEKNFVTSMANTPISVAAKRMRLVINCKAGVDCSETGTLVTLLFILPDDIKQDHEYSISFGDKAFNFISADPLDDYKAAGINGYVMISENGAVDPVTTTTEAVTTTEEVTTTEPVTTTTEVTTTVTEPVTTTEVTTTVTEPVTTTEKVTTTEPVTTTEVTTTVTEPVTTTEVTTTVTEPVTTTEVTTTVTEPVTTTEVTTVTEPVTTTEVTTTVTEPVTTTEITTTTEPVTTTEVTTTTPPVTTLPSIDIIIGADKDKVKTPVQGETVVLEEDSMINVVVPGIKVKKGSDKAAVTIQVSGFDADKEHFEYAGFGIELPEGFTVDAENITMLLEGSEIKYYSPNSPMALIINEYTKTACNGGYIALMGADTSKLGEVADILNFAVNIPEGAEAGDYKISVISLFGRLTGINQSEDGKLEPVVSLIKNNGANTTTTESVISVTEAALVETVFVEGSYKVTPPDRIFYYSYETEFDRKGLKVTADCYNLYDDGTKSETVTVDVTDRCVIVLDPFRKFDGVTYEYEVMVADTALSTSGDEADVEMTYIGSFKAYIGKRGDITLDRAADSRDMAKIVDIYNDNLMNDTDASDADKTEMEKFAEFLGDITGDGVLDSRDIAFISQFYNEMMFDENANEKDVWDSLLKK